MTRDRTELQQKLEDILGSRNVYFQPPSNIRMKFPAIVYERSKIEKIPADNVSYRLLTAYDVTLIHPDPDTPLLRTLLELPYCTFDRQFASDNLNHFTFTIYF